MANLVKLYRLYRVMWWTWWWNPHRINTPNVTMWRNSCQNSWMIKKKHTEKSIHTYTYNIYIYILIRIHFLFGIFQPSCIIGSPAPVKRAGTALYEDLDAWALPASPPWSFTAFPLKNGPSQKGKSSWKSVLFIGSMLNFGGWNIRI